MRILKRRKGELLEREEENGKPFYYHAPRCEGGCDYDCNGMRGWRLAAISEKKWRARRAQGGGK